MRIVMVEKGREYSTDDGKIKIVKTWDKGSNNETSYITLNTYRQVSSWNVLGVGETIYNFKTLNEAKAFVKNEIKQLQEGEIK